MNVGSTQNIKSFEILTSSVLLFVGASVILPIFFGAYFHKEQQSRSEEQVLAYQIMQIHQKTAEGNQSGAELQRGPASVLVETFESKDKGLIHQIGKDPWGNPYNYQVQLVEGRPQVKIWSRGPVVHQGKKDQIAQTIEPGPDTFVQIFE